MYESAFGAGHSSILSEVVANSNWMTESYYHSSLGEYSNFNYGFNPFDSNFFLDPPPGAVPNLDDFGYPEWRQNDMEALLYDLWEADRNESMAFRVGVALWGIGVLQEVHSWLNGNPNLSRGAMLDGIRTLLTARGFNAALVGVGAVGLVDSWYWDQRGDAIRRRINEME